MFLSRYVKGVPFFSGRYTKRVPFLSKMVFCKRVRGCTSGQSLPVQKFVECPPGLFGSTFARNYLSCRIKKNEIWDISWIFALATTRSERVNYNLLNIKFQEISFQWIKHFSNFNSPEQNQGSSSKKNSCYKHKTRTIFWYLQVQVTN